MILTIMYIILGILGVVLLIELALLITALFLLSPEEKMTMIEDKKREEREYIEAYLDNERGVMTRYIGNWD